MGFDYGSLVQPADSDLALVKLSLNHIVVQVCLGIIATEACLDPEEAPFACAAFLLSMLGRIGKASSGVTGPLPIPPITLHKQDIMGGAATLLAGSFG